MKIGRFETNNIYCEDSYKAICDIPDKSIDCIYTDIPYLYNQGGSGSSELGERTAKKRLELMGALEGFSNANMTYGEMLKNAKKEQKVYNDYVSIEDGINYNILNEFVRVMKRINIFIWCSKLQLLEIMKFFIEEHNCYFELIVWCKTNPTPSVNNSWLPDLEYCLYFREKGVSLNEGYELKSKWYDSPINKRDKDKFNHPTIKPLDLVKRHILHTTKPNDIVADFFMGSGTTCVACKDTDRQYIGFEIVEKWFKIAQDRLNCLAANGQISLFLT